jgi:hypothetical protein
LASKILKSKSFIYGKENLSRKNSDASSKKRFSSDPKKPVPPSEEIKQQGLIRK